MRTPLANFRIEIVDVFEGKTRAAETETGQRLLQDVKRAFIGFEESGDEPQQRCFAGAVGPRETGDMTAKKACRQRRASGSRRNALAHASPRDTSH